MQSTPLKPAESPAQGALSQRAGGVSQLQSNGTGRRCLLFVEAFVVAPQWIERSITTMWDPRVINWFVKPINYSYEYHKP